MKKTFGILFFILCSVVAFAQQVGMNNHYFYRPFLYNPAYTGIHENVELFISRRDQWNSISKAPQINIFSVDGSVNNKKISLGINVLDEKYGFNKRTGFNFNYAYHIEFNAETSLSFGLAVGMTFHTVDFSNVITQDYSDLTLFAGNQQTSNFNGNAGFVFAWKNFEFNSAVPQLLGNSVKFYDASTGINTDYTLRRHFISSLKYKFELSKENKLFLVPNVITRFIPNAPFQYDGTMTLQWINKGWIGATYKNRYAVSANAGVSLFRRLDIGYSYEFISSKLKNHSGLSHEIILKIQFGAMTKKQKNKEEDYVANETENSDSIPEDTSAISESTNSNKASDNNTIVENKNPLNEENNSTTNNSKNETEINNTNSETKNTTANNTITNPSNNNLKRTNQENNNSSINSNENNKNTSSKYYESGVLIMKDLALNYKSMTNKTPQKGFYVIVGTFFYRDFAEDEAKRIAKMSGYKTGVVFSGSKEYNYIYVSNEKTLESAIQKAKIVQSKGFKDAWIKVLE